MESFFGIGLPELVVIILIAGIVMGPERISVVARWLGRTTAQLQTISRTFLNQLNAEIDGVSGSSEIRGALQEVQDLQSQLEQLKQEFLSVTNGAVRDGQKAMNQTRAELERTIAPPTKRPSNNQPAAEKEEAFSPEALPSRLEIPDDPE
jgi:Tat protein translocase TatB subunit